jgi:hypothetical protein
MEGSNKRKIKLAALIAGLMVLVIAAAVAFLFFVPAPGGSTAPLEEPPSGLEDKGSSVVEEEIREDIGEGVADPDAPPPSLLDLPGVHPASGEFALGGIPEGKEFDLSENAGRYAAIIAAIQSADPDFDPEGYMVEEHVSHHDENRIPDHGNVRVTLYIGDIKTSSSCYVNVDGSDIQFVSITRLYHPTSAEIEQAKQQKADFEASPASGKAIEKAKASMWPDDTGTTQLEYSEYYGYVFKTGRLFFYIVDNRAVAAMDGTISAKTETIDCLEVLGR